MKKYKICFWLNVPSNHQTLFLDELNISDKIDLKVCYFAKPSSDRLKMGWRDESNLKNYEFYIKNSNEKFIEIEDWKERIHIVMGYSYKFNRELIPIFIKNNVKWIHWSERYGIKLAELLNFNTFLFKLIYPLFLLTKKTYANLVQKYAFGCFSQGYLAKKDFIKLGIDKKKIRDLYYTTLPLNRLASNENILGSFSYKYIFIYVGRLNPRKGISELIIAFSTLKNKEEWGLLLIGEDESSGYYKTMIQDKSLQNSILCTGSIHSDRVVSFLNKASVFVLPSKYDGWGAVLNESASIGLALISTDQTGSAYHLIEEEKNGYIVEAGNVEALNESMQKYVNNHKLIEAHSIHSKKISDRFTPKANVKRFLNALNEWSEKV